MPESKVRNNEEQSATTRIDETSVLSQLSYGPEITEPPGLEPGTSCLKACSSIGIRRTVLKGVTSNFEDFMFGVTPNALPTHRRTLY